MIYARKGNAHDLPIFLDHHQNLVHKQLASRSHQTPQSQPSLQYHGLVYQAHTWLRGVSPIGDTWHIIINRKGKRHKDAHKSLVSLYLLRQKVMLKPQGEFVTDGSIRELTKYHASITIRYIYLFIIDQQIRKHWTVINQESNHHHHTSTTQGRKKPATMKVTVS